MLILLIVESDPIVYWPLNKVEHGNDDFTLTTGVAFDQDMGVVFTDRTILQSDAPNTGLARWIASQSSV